MWTPAQCFSDMMCTRIESLRELVKMWVLPPEVWVGPETLSNMPWGVRRLWRLLLPGRTGSGVDLARGSATVPCEGSDCKQLRLCGPTGKMEDFVLI